jgi:hypothetical protein
MGEFLSAEDFEKEGYRVAAFSFRQKGEPRGEIAKLWGSSFCFGVVTKYHPLPSGSVFGGMIIWQPVPRNITSTDTEKKRLAHFFSELPSEAFLEKVTDTCQLEAWVEAKKECLWIAQCLMAGGEAPDNPLILPLEQGEIDKFKHDYLWLITKYYDNLWWLLNTKHQKISKALKNKGHQQSTPLFLIKEIAKGNIEGEFQQIFKSHYTFSEYDLRRISTYGKKLCTGQLRGDEQQRFKQLLKKHSNPSIWLDRILEICGVLAERDRLIQNALQYHYTICNSMYSMLQDSTHKPEIRHYGKSFTFLHGKKTKGVNNFEL